MDDFKAKIYKTIEICYKELDLRNKGIDGESTINQLNTIISELRNILKSLDKQEIVPVNKRYLKSFASAFTVWGWNMNTPTELFTLLTELNNEYKNIDIIGKQKMTQVVIMG